MPTDQLSTGLTGNLPTDQLSTGATGNMPTDQLSTGVIGNMPTDQLSTGITGHEGLFPVKWNAVAPGIRLMCIMDPLESIGNQFN